MKMLAYSVLPAVLLMVAISGAAQQSQGSTIKMGEWLVEVRVFDDRNTLQTTRKGFFIGTNGDVVTSRDSLLAATRAEVRTIDSKSYAVTGVRSEYAEGNLVRLSTTASRFVGFPELKISLPQENEKLSILGKQGTVEVRALNAGEMIPFGHIFDVRGSSSADITEAPVINGKGELIGRVSSIQRNAGFVVFGADILGKLSASAASLPLPEWKVKVQPDWQSTDEGLYAAGIRLSLEKEHEKAALSFKKALDINRNNYKAAFRLARANRDMKKFETAIEYYSLALKLKPDFAEAYGGIGLAYESLKQSDKAIDAFKRALSQSPRYETPYLRLAKIYTDQGRDKEADAIITQLTKANPNSLVGQLWLGWIYTKAKNLDLAERAYRRALQINPESSAVHSALGGHLVQRKNNEAALDHLRKASALEPGSSKRLTALADVLLDMGKQDEAHKIYKQAVKFETDDLKKYYLLAWSQSHERDHKAAIDSYRKALALKPDESFIHFRLGWEYYYCAGMRTRSLVSARRLGWTLRIMKLTLDWVALTKRSSGKMKR